MNLPIPNQNLRCLQCNSDGTLQHQGGVYRCVNCLKAYEIREDIIIISEDSLPYTEIPLDEYRKILQEMDQQPWQDVVNEKLAQSYPFLWQIMTDEARADWVYFFDL